MATYYNDNDPTCVEWLRDLIARGLLPDGDVDGRPIEEVSPEDVKGYVQCHWFAGIGGFALAAKMAGWPDDLELWTGGFPCQVYSEAGDQKAEKDERFLWPELYRLIHARRPDQFLGENVRGIVDLGLDRVLTDLEDADYAQRAYRIPACALDAPHRRDRIWMVALANAPRVRRDGRQEPPTRDFDHGSSAERNQGSGGSSLAVSGTNSPWAGAEVVVGPDQKRRRFEPRVHPLADGVSRRMELVRGYGNAIVPQVAAVILSELLRVVRC